MRTALVCDDQSLLTRTRELLKSYPGTYFSIYDGTGIQPTWLSALATGRIKNPSVNKVQRLYEFLRGQPLSL